MTGRVNFGTICPMQRALFIPAFLILAACGGPRPSADALQTAAPATAPVVAPNFDDTDPHEWQGRTPDHYPVHGIDTSRWQSDVDWATARENGVNFAFIKATEGGDGVDPAFAENWHAAQRAGVARGAYHFFYHCRPASEQAEWFIRNVPRAAGALPPVLDIEWTPFSPTCTTRRPAAEIRAEARDFLNAVQSHYGQRPIIYSTVDFYQENELWKLGPYPFWLRSVAGHPTEVYGNRPFAFWQYTSTGLVPGVSGETDLNVFAGTRRAWDAWLAENTL